MICLPRKAFRGKSFLNIIGLRLHGVRGWLEALVGSDDVTGQEGVGGGLSAVVRVGAVGLVYLQKMKG